MCGSVLRSWRLGLSVVFSVLLLVFCATATSAPMPGRLPTNSGQILQQVAPPSQPKPASHLGLKIKRRSSGHSSSTIKFPVRVIKITGNTLLSTKKLHSLVASAEGKRLTLGQLDALADRITKAYQKHGYPLDSAYIPPQTIRNGVVRIAVLEAHYGKVALKNQSEVSNKPLKATLSPLKSGQPVSEYKLERSLLLLSDIPGAKVHSVIRPGSTAGSSNLRVRVTSAPRYTGTVGVDDYGDRYTGRWRLTGNFNINGLFHEGDLLSFSGLTTGRDMNYGRLHYRYLLNGEGTTVGASVSALNYKLAHGLSDLHAHGNALVESLDFRHPIIRNTDGNLYGKFVFQHKRLNDDIDVVSLKTDRLINVATASLAGDLRDSTGVTNLSGSITYGRLHFKNNVAKFFDSIGARTQGDYTKYDVSLSRLQQINATNAFYFSVSAQWANSNLDSSEQFYLGGPNTVPGFYRGVLSGAEGNLETIEFRHDMRLPLLPGRFQLSLFANTGHVKVYKNPFAPGPNSGRASSAGGGLNWFAPHGISISAKVATPIGPTPDLIGPNGDTSTRFWVQIQKGFSL